jgi:hypothetical protein
LEEIVEEIDVEAGLNEAGDVGDPVVLVVSLRVRSIHPVHNVESTVDTQQEHIMTRQVLDFSVSLQENQLWDDRHCLQIDGELPKGLRKNGGKLALTPV